MWQEQCVQPLPPTPERRFAFDVDVLHRLVAAIETGAVPVNGNEETLAAVRLLVYGGSAILLPTVEGELAEFTSVTSVGSIPMERLEQNDHFLGCAKAKADTYLQFYPDPRDCHLVGEAECAHLDALVTLKTDLLSGLRDRAEVSIVTPIAYWERLAIPRGATARRHLATVPLTDEWRW